jgi:hypothetical protein
MNYSDDTIYDPKKSKHSHLRFFQFLGIIPKFIIKDNLLLIINNKFGYESEKTYPLKKIQGVNTIYAPDYIWMVIGAMFVIGGLGKLFSIPLLTFAGLAFGLPLFWYGKQGRTQILLKFQGSPDIKFWMIGRDDNLIAFAKTINQKIQY